MAPSRRGRELILPDPVSPHQEAAVGTPLVASMFTLYAPHQVEGCLLRPPLSPEKVLQWESLGKLVQPEPMARGDSPHSTAPP